MKVFLDWVFNHTSDQIGNALYVFCFLWISLCLFVGHRTNKINLWQLVTATDRNGVERTDAAKFFIAGLFAVMMITFLFLAVTRQLSEWYVLICAICWLGERFRRDIIQLKQISMLGATDAQKTSAEASK